MQQKPEWADQDDVLFVNILIEDSTEAVKAKVTRRLAMLPERVKNRAAKRAGKLTKPRRIAQQVSRKMLKKIPDGMKEKGVTVDMEEIFLEGPYIVFQMRVVHVNALVLTNDRMESFSDFVQWFMASVGEDWQQTIEGEYLPKQILRSLKHEIPKLLAKKMEEKKLVTETIVHTDCAKQARYFSSKVKEIREQEEVQQRFLTRSIHRMSNSFGSTGSLIKMLSAASSEELSAASQ